MFPASALASARCISEGVQLRLAAAPFSLKSVCCFLADCNQNRNVSANHKVALLITVNTTIFWCLCQIKLQGSVFRPRYCHLQDIALHENKLQWPDDLCVSKLIYQSIDFSIIHVACQYEILKTVKICDTSV